MKNLKLSFKNLAVMAAAALSLALLTRFTGLPVAWASSTVVRFDPPSAAISPNQTIAVKVQIDNAAGLLGAEFHMSYDPAILEVQDANPGVEGIQIATGSLLTDFVAQNRVDPTQGKIDFGVLQLPPHSAATGSGVLATITFKGKAAGVSQLTFNTVNLAGENGAAISASVQNGQVTVGAGNEPTPTPAPVNPTPTPVPINPTPTPAPGYPTPTPPPYNPPVTPAPPSGNILGYHVVRARETLFCIGRAYSVLPWAIAAQNGIGYPYGLRIGQTLAIPNVTWLHPSDGPVCPAQFGGGSQPTPAPSGCRATHIVQRGDTLSSIARRYGTSAWAIAVANNIANPNLIFPGQALCIP